MHFWIQFDFVCCASELELSRSYRSIKIIIITFRVHFRSPIDSVVLRMRIIIIVYFNAMNVHLIRNLTICYPPNSIYICLLLFDSFYVIY